VLNIKAIRYKSIFLKFQTIFKTLSFPSTIIAQMHSPENRTLFFLPQNKVNKVVVGKGAMVLLCNFSFRSLDLKRMYISGRQEDLRYKENLSATGEVLCPISPSIASSLGVMNIKSFQDILTRNNKLFGYGL
jgi:hypothetical protein